MAGSDLSAKQIQAAATALITSLALAGLTGCTRSNTPASAATAAAGLDQCAAPAPTRLNHIQSVGSHNSYKLAIPKAELAMIALSEPDIAASLDYSHLPLSQQLDLGMRQLELDLYHDPEGGHYDDPLLPRMAASQGATPFDPAGLDQPGFKVMHVQDIDARSHCARFVECLGQINQWSLNHPGHVPILILINAKQADIDIPGAAKVVPFDADAFTQLDAEIMTVLDRSRLIIPDDVRGNDDSLRGSVLTTGWPELAQARGKLLFALDEGPETVTVYMRGKASLEGLVMFVNSISEQADHAAYFTFNDPLGDADRIQAALAKGFLVRTRADADTVEARSGDTARRDAALASGAQYISTDYYQPRTEFSDYQVALPGGGAARCGPR